MLKYDQDHVKHPAIYDNNRGITDLNDLLRVESGLSSARTAKLLAKPSLVKGNFDTAHLQNIHKYIFQDIYPSWAGQIRDTDISKGNTLFCRCPYIQPLLNDTFGKLKKQNYGKGQSLDEFSGTLATLSDDMNAAHPFREGNGRSKRLFLQLLSKNAGYTLDFSKMSGDMLRDAEIKAFTTGNTTALQQTYRKCLSAPSAMSRSTNFVLD